MLPPQTSDSPELPACPIVTVPLTRRRVDEEDERAEGEAKGLLANSAYASQSRNYEEARHLHTLGKERRARAKAQRIEQELKRQQRECAKLSEAHQVRIARHSQKAAEQAAQAETHWASKIDALRQRHVEDLERYENELRYRDQLECEKPPIHSSHVRDMQQVEQRLAGSACFEEARMVRTKICDLERKELEQMEINREQRVQRRLGRMREKQNQEDRFLQTQAKNALSVQSRKAGEEVQRLRRNLANLAQDMTHAHRVELTAPPGVGQYQQPHFIKLRPRKQAPTSCLGTAVLEKEKGPKLVNIPSLCNRYGDQLDCFSGPRQIEISSFPRPSEDEG